jgi:hypothetical protein
MSFTASRDAARVSTEPAAVEVALALDEIELRCLNMNAGSPGWDLRDRVLAVCKGGAKAGDR